jgi:hypothetical protein
MSRNGVHKWIEKFTRGRSKVVDDARPGRPVETATKVTVQRLAELIRADKKDNDRHCSNCTRMFSHAFNIQHNV